MTRLGLLTAATVNAAADPEARRRERLARVLAPLLLGAVVLAAWEIFVRVNDVPPYILPGPALVAEALVDDWGSLWPSLLITVEVTLAALVVATAGGLLLAVLLAQSKWVELSFFPYAIVLQVTPAIAIAPLILISVGNVEVALMICAWLVAFFPILSSTTLGLNAADRNLLALFRLYGATRWQTLRHLRLPSAIPSFLAGLRIAAGLALLGAVVAEFAAGSVGTSSGLAYRILESGYRLEIPRMLAALLLILLTGIAIFLAFALLQHLTLRRWYESAVRRED